jgi:hypothetical protein
MLSALFPPPPAQTTKRTTKKTTEGIQTYLQTYLQSGAAHADINPAINLSYQSLGIILLGIILLGIILL